MPPFFLYGGEKMPTVSELITQSYLNGDIALGWLPSPIQDALDRRGIDVTKYGATGKGIKDDTSAIQTVLNYAQGKTVIFPPGIYKTNGITIPNNTVIVGYGAKIFNSTVGSVILNIGNQSKVYGLEIQGSGNATYQDNDRGVQIVGSYNAVISVINYITDVLFEDCYIHDCGGYGIFTQYAKHVKINRCRIEHIGYSGIQVISSENVHVMGRTLIKEVSPGTGTLAYGVAFTRTGAVTDLVQYPRSKDCSVTNCNVEDVPLWEGLDTHGGENILFEGNTVRNCKTGIACTAATGNGGTNLYGPQFCVVTNNTVYGIGQGYGVVFLGATTDYASSCSASGNTLYQCGQQGNNISGAIFAQNTKDLNVIGNVLNQCYAVGINIYFENKGFKVSSNNIRDIQDNTYTLAPCIALRSTGNEGIISDNVLYRENAALNTYVSVNGILFSTTTGTDVVIGHNFNNCSTKITGGNGQTFKYETYGNGMQGFVGAGSPEGVITAIAGSEYRSITGGGGVTLYTKETGTGNTGWSAQRGGYLTSVSATPAYIGQEALVAGVWYKASGTSSNADWKALN